MKTADSMANDLKYSLEVLGFVQPDIDEALALIGKLTPDQVSASGKPHYAFLKAVGKGWNEARGNLGKELRVNIDVFREYVAEESKSCFVDYIELYYSCPLTDQGIVLVDTPGADSINARHTGVAFDYIKNADAILFVTYYNHAFSQADREFLLQLGRVKDSFEMDKMFFVVNAADLASTAGELEGVIKHVEENLLQYGIRYPRIYPVSSLMAVEGKLRADREALTRSGLSAFEADFDRFTLEELTDIAVHAAVHEMRRSFAVLQQWIQASQADEQQRRTKVEELRKAHEQAVSQLNEAAFETEDRELAKEIHELLYYVKQRNFFRFGELYNFAFNPAALADDGRNMKEALRAAGSDLIRLIAFNLSQEVLATTLRIENFLNQLAKKRYDEWALKMREYAFEAESCNAVKFVTPNIAETLDGVVFDDKWLMSYFKNGKHFFEGEGKKQLRAVLEQTFNAPVTSFLENHASLLLEQYEKQYHSRINEMNELQRQSVKEHFEGLISALEQKVNVDELLEKQRQLQRLMDN